MRTFLLLAVILVVLALTDARRPKNKPWKNRKQNTGNGCKYVRPVKAGPWTDCVEGMRNKTLTLKPGSPDTCEPVRILSKKCNMGKGQGKNKDCYTVTVDNSGCADGTGMRRIVKTPKGTDGCGTEPITIEKPCRARGGRPKRDCIYNKLTAVCDAETNMETRTLKKALNGADCPPTEVVECSVKGGNRMEKKQQRKQQRKEKRKEMRKERRQGGANACKYKLGKWGKCDPATNLVQRQSTLRRGDPTTCQPTKVEQRACRRRGSKKKNVKKKKRKTCRYAKAEWGNCDSETNTKTRTVPLRAGDPDTCNATRVQTRSCKPPKRSQGCKYKRNPWGPCDAASNLVTRTLTLKSGDQQLCNATKIETMKCKDKHLRPQVCTYKRTSWGDCDPVTNIKSMVKSLKNGDPSKCQPSVTVTRKCKRKVKQGTGCKYTFEDWGECDITTNTMRRRQTLKSGNPATCPEVKFNTRKCKIPCKFKNGAWSACDPLTGMMERTDTLVKGSQKFCVETRLITKKCGTKKGKRKKCLYEFGTWEQCNADTNKRNRVRRLKSGDDDCEQEKIETKSCTRSNGEVRCFFGEWQDYGECQNGVQKKQRVVLQGDMDCQRKAVKMKSC